MKTFALFDQNGFPVGFWNNDVFPDVSIYASGEDQEPIGYSRNPLIPDDVTEITTQQWQALINNQGLRIWKDGHVVPYTPPGPTPEEQRKLDFPNLEPDQFWFVVRASGYEPDLLAWVASMNDPESLTYNPVSWAAASAKLEFAKYFERDHEFVEAAREAIGMTATELDALWQFGLS